MPMLNYLTPCDFDFGALARLGEHMGANGLTRPLICTDKGIVAAGLLDKVIAALPEGTQSTTFDETPGNPTEEAVLAALAVYKDNGCDGLVAIGGGSSIDLAKGVGLLATHEGALESFGITQGGIGKITELAPLIAIPTTAGTGSEVSVGTVIILENGFKETFASPNFLPKTAICDPELTLGLPAGLTAATGMDAVTHCIEAFLSPAVNPPAEGVALDGLERAIRQGFLEKAVADGSDRDARWHMMMASTEGALAFVKGLGAVHSMSHACGRMKQLGLHHGTLNAVILPAVLRYNAPSCADKYERLRRAMGLSENADLADAISDLNARIGLPANLKEMGVSADMMDDLVAYAARDMATYTTPVPPDAAAYVKLFEDALG
ncbi:MAG: iron-containing alcohol dehydrogenase [Alphaproteobacteria bacterium]